MEENKNSKDIKDSVNKESLSSTTAGSNNISNLNIDLELMGYSPSEVSILIEKNFSLLNRSQQSNYKIDIEKDELVNHLKNTKDFRAYPKSTLLHMINVYTKRHKSVSIDQEFYSFVKKNIETVDQELWTRDNVVMTTFDEPSSVQIYEFEQAELKSRDKYLLKKKELDRLKLQSESDDKIESSMSSLANKKQDYRNLIAGTFCSLISRTMVAPFDRLKMLYQVNYIGKLQKPPSIREGLINIYKQDGIKGYFKGNLINNLKGSPESGIRLYTFELIKWKLQMHHKDERLTKLQLFFSGAMSGVVATTCIFPLEVLKLRIAASAHGTYNSIFDALVKIYREPRGIVNFYSGLEASICAVIPNAGLNLTVYETLKIFFSGKSSIDNASYLSTGMLMFIGGFSALISSTVLYPLQIIQARMIMQI